MSHANVSVSLITSYLDQLGWHEYQSMEEEHEREGLVITGWQDSPGQPHRLVIDPMIEKSVLVFRVPYVLSAPPDSTPADRLSGLLLMMGCLNYHLFLGRWCYDPGDGEVSFKLGVPIDDGQFTFRTFAHCMATVGLAVEGDAAALGAILRGTKTVSEALADARDQ